MERKYLWILGIISLLGIIAVSGCIQIPLGRLEGKVSIGPLCPVERIPPDPNCLPTNETYKAWPIGIWTPSKVIEVARIQPSPPDGTYRLELPAGTYIADLEKPQTFGARNLPATITIKPGETTMLNIDIDTGIR
jgi:hypothetical protein